MLTQFTKWFLFSGENPDFQLGEESPDFRLREESPDFRLGEESPDFRLGEESPNFRLGEESPTSGWEKRTYCSITSQTNPGFKMLLYMYSVQRVQCMYIFTICYCTVLNSTVLYCTVLY